ncbi:MAG: hypothetical protein WDA75_22610 [Candidatus Latescibacterota bacterium]
MTEPSRPQSVPPRSPGRGSAVLLVLLFLAAISGCGVPERDHVLDPANPNPVDIAALLVGTWSRVDAEKNEIYTLKADGRVELYDYTAPGGGEVDRNGSYPQTLVITYYGSYALVGNLLRLSFTGGTTNNPDGSLPALPEADKVVSIQVTRTTLTLKERDGDRVYTRI